MADLIIGAEALGLTPDTAKEWTWYEEPLGEVDLREALAPVAFLLGLDEQTGPESET